LFQIWIFPNQKQVTPRYAQRKYDIKSGAFTALVGPQESNLATWIHQDAWFHLGTFDNGVASKYAIKKPGNGVYAFVLKGKFNLDGIDIENRDGLGIWETEEFMLTSSEEGSEILLMEVPMV
jgi:redox-sensitive bicupin YhaK (pirin superfamily)